MSLLALGLFAGLAWANPADDAAIPTELMDIARESSDLPLGDRMRAISQPLKGLPYQVDPIGEGAGVADDFVTGVCENVDKAVLGGDTHLAWCASVVEIIGSHSSLQCSPVYPA